VCSQPLGCCYTKEQQALWERWLALKNRVSRLEGTVRYLRGVKKTVIIKQRLSASIRGAPGPEGPPGPQVCTHPHTLCHPLCAVWGVLKCMRVLKCMHIENQMNRYENIDVLNAFEYTL
jgi:hypothetical protein